LTNYATKIGGEVNTAIYIEKVIVVALAGPGKILVETSQKILNKSVDEGSALLIYTLKPVVKGRVDLEEPQYQINNTQLVVRFKLFFERKKLWTGYTSLVVPEASYEFTLAPTELANLSSQRRNRDVIGNWEVKVSMGVLDLIEYNSLSPRRQPGYMRDLEFQDSTSVKWRVHIDTKPRTQNRFGQFNRGDYNEEQTVNLNDI
jgi:hypothetical protein